jgi:hypothetical protein
LGDIMLSGILLGYWLLSVIILGILGET